VIETPECRNDLARRLAAQPCGGMLSPCRVRRRGLSLVEIMVAIAVLAILMTLGVLGYRSMESKSADKGTKTVLSNAHGMIAEFEANAGRQRLEGTGGMFPTGATYPSPGILNPGGGGRGNAIENCKRALRLLQQTPKNKEVIGQIPSKLTVTGTADNNSPPALADGWGNPIVYVPSGGLTGVQIGRKPDGGYDKTITVTAPNKRPFWASAGVDGDLSTGDDNVYSFENR
jgi:prepilin-type N-terminal cleavage/methylation domain-containing protein